MTTAEYIKRLRKGDNIYKKKWSQEELGAALNPPVKRAAIWKWEHGTIKNIKKTHVEQMATLFGIQPEELMCFEKNENNPEKFNENMLNEIQTRFGMGAIDLLICFGKLNDSGKEKALEYISDIIENPKYNKR